MKSFIFSVLVAGGCTLLSCSSSRFLSQAASENLLRQPDLVSAHTGICIYDPAASTYLYNYQANKYFVPASNTKLFSLYAGMKYLGDSLPGIKFMERDSAMLLLPTGDPSFLHPDYPLQPVLDFLKATGKKMYMADAGWQDEAWGTGWSWDDYNDDYMAERSPLPVYGNIVRWVQEKQLTESQESGLQSPISVYSLPEVNWKVQFSTDTAAKHFFVRRSLDQNIFSITEGNENYKMQDVPFVTHGLQSALELLKDTLGKEILILQGFPAQTMSFRTLYSRPADSLFRPMMYRSDNFFAEQTLLMVCAKRFGMMKDQLIIDSLLNKDLLGLPQRPRWVDGSGLSRFNLFTPLDFVWLLNQMKNEFGLDRMKRLLPTSGLGTLSNFNKQDSGFIFAKTGSLSGVIALSGYLISRQNRLLIFSILVNNHHGNSSAIRKDIEHFLSAVRQQN